MGNLLKSTVCSKKLERGSFETLRLILLSNRAARSLLVPGFDVSIFQELMQSAGCESLTIQSILNQ